MGKQEQSDSGRKPRWRLALLFAPIIIGACWMLLLDVVRELLADIHRASFAGLTAMIEWASHRETPQ